MINPSHAIADTGATSLFLTKGAPCLNKRRTQTPISVTLPDGRKITSSHICDVRIPGLPTVLTGHIMPEMTTASLFGIRILCKAGCKIVFDEEKCQVFYENNIILTGFKDPASDLWTLPILPDDSPQTTLDATRQSSPGPCLGDVRCIVLVSSNDARKQRKIHAPKPVQPSKIVTVDGNSPRLPPWRPSSEPPIGSKVSPTKHGHG